MDKNSYPALIQWIVIAVVVIESLGNQCNVERSISGTGFHRELRDKFKLKLPYHGNCSILLLQHVPNGLYVDLHEIHMKEAIGIAKVIAEESIDIEKPEYISPEHKIFITEEVNIGTDGEATTLVRVPIHLRYHRPSTGKDRAEVPVNRPETFIWCHEGKEFQRVQASLYSREWLRAPCHHLSHGKICQWNPLECEFKSGHMLTLEVPVGSVEDTFAVVLLSLVGTVIGVVAIMLSLRHTPDQTYTGIVYKKSEHGKHEQSIVNCTENMCDSANNESDDGVNSQNLNTKHSEDVVQCSSRYNFRNRNK